MASDRKWIYLSFVTAVLILSWVLSQALSLGVQYVKLPNPMVMGVLPASSLVALGVMSISGYFYFRQEKVQAFSLEVMQEMRKVTWPPRKNAYLSTIMVVVATIIVAVILGLFDWLCGSLMDLVI